MRVRGACRLVGLGRCGLGLGGRWKSGVRSGRGPANIGFGAASVGLFCMVASGLLAPGALSIFLSECGECVLMRFSEGYVTWCARWLAL